MSDWAPKRFWTEATVEPCAAGFTVRLDGRAVKTPAKAAFEMPSQALAEAAAEEWRDQKDMVDPKTMPVTRAVNAAIDKVTPQFDEVVALLAEFGDSDVTCYRAALPEGLVARQAAIWDPLLDWAAEAYQARLVPVEGVMHAAQDARALARLAAPLKQMTAFELTAMHDLVSLSGSLVIGLAAFDGARPLETLWEASRVDEEWQIAQWGVDDEAAEVAQAKRDAFLQAGRFLDFLRVQ